MQVLRYKKEFANSFLGHFLEFRNSFFIMFPNKRNSLNLPKSTYLAVIYNTISLPLRTILILYNPKSPHEERFWVIDGGELQGILVIPQVDY